MPIPTVSQFRIPLLNLLGDGSERTLADAANALADGFRLTPEEKAAKLASSGYSIVRHRTGWAAFHLRKAGLVDDQNKGWVSLTPEGIAFLKTKPTDLSDKALMKLPRYAQWKNAVSKAAPSFIAAEVPDDEASPEEAIANGYSQLRANLAAELLERIAAKPSVFFEHLVVDLLLAMGYGGSRAEAGTVTKASGDGGIDGVINEDRLGLDAVYVQAKRWAKERTVGVKDLREFVGSLAAHKAQKGVFITTSDFVRPARDYVSQVAQKIVLINGTRLAELMIDYNVGVSTRITYELKRADEDYFSDE